MRKKLFSFVLAMCLIVPCCFALVACTNTVHTCTFENAWSKDETYHWHKCTDEACEKVSDKAEHTWNDGVVTTPASSSAKGVKTFTCTVCEQTKTEEVNYVPTKTLTETEWNNAVSFAGITNYSATSSSSANPNYSTLVKIDGDKVYYKQVQYPTIGDESAEFYTEDIYVKNGSNYSYYGKSKSDNSWIDQTPHNSQGTIQAEFYQCQPSMTFMMFEYDKFTFNATSGKYECASITFKYDGASETIENISLEFEDGRIKSGSFGMSGLTLSYLISYEPCTVTVPTV